MRLIASRLVFTCTRFLSSEASMGVILVLRLTCSVLYFLSTSSSTCHHFSPGLRWRMIWFLMWPIIRSARGAWRRVMLWAMRSLASQFWISLEVRAASASV